MKELFRFIDARPPVGIRGPAKCKLCEAAGRTRTPFRTETGRVAHLEDYHGLCQGCRFEHALHRGHPCAMCQCGHTIEPAADSAP